MTPPRDLTGAYAVYPPVITDRHENPRKLAIAQRIMRLLADQCGKTGEAI